MTLLENHGYLYPRMVVLTIGIRYQAVPCSAMDMYQLQTTGEGLGADLLRKTLTF